MQSILEYIKKTKSSNYLRSIIDTISTDFDSLKQFEEVFKNAGIEKSDSDWGEFITSATKYNKMMYDITEYELNVTVPTNEPFLYVISIFLTKKKELINIAIDKFVYNGHVDRLEYWERYSKGDIKDGINRIKEIFSQCIV